MSFRGGNGCLCWGPENSDLSPSHCCLWGVVRLVLALISPTGSGPWVSALSLDLISCPPPLQGDSSLISTLCGQGSHGAAWVGASKAESTEETAGLAQLAGGLGGRAGGCLAQMQKSMRGPPALTTESQGSYPSPDPHVGIATAARLFSPCHQSPFSAGKGMSSPSRAGSARRESPRRGGHHPNSAPTELMTLTQL